MLELSHVTGQEDSSGYRPPIIMATALDGTGAPEVWEAVEAHAEHLRSTDTLELRRARRLRMEVHNRVEQLLNAATDAALESRTGAALLERASNRDISPAAAARSLDPRHSQPQVAGSDLRSVPSPQRRPARRGTERRCPT